MKRKNNCPLKIELDNCLERIKAFFTFHFIFFQPSAVVPLTSHGLLAEPLWYTWVNTHFSTLILSGTVLSPTEGNSGNVLTWRLHMPDKATSLIGLHGAAVGLIGWDCGITEREKKWEWNAGIGRKRQNAGSRVPHYLLIDTVCRRGAASQRENKTRLTPTPTPTFQLC